MNQWEAPVKLCVILMNVATTNETDNEVSTVSEEHA